MKFLLAFLKILSLYCVLAGNTDDSQSTSSGESQNQTYTFDISSDSKYVFVLSDRKVFDNVDYEQCKVKEGLKINKIVDGDLNIWENNTNFFKSGSLVYDAGKPVLMNLEEYDILGLKYFKKHLGTWHQIEESQYNQALKNLRDGVPTKSTFALNLRFTSENPKYVVEKFTKKFVNLFVYTPTMGHRAKFVYDNGKLIWRATEPSQRCVTAIAYLRGEIPLLAHIFIASDDLRVTNLYFKRENGNWIEVDENQYPVDVLSLRYENEQFNPIRLDMESFDYQNFEVKSSSFEHPYLKYMPKEPNRITSVSFGEQLIWQSQDPSLYYASSVDYFEKGGSPILRVNLNYRYPHFYLVYVKTDKGWEDGDEFDVDDRIISLQCDRYKVLDLAYIENDSANILPLKMENVDYMLISPKMSSEIMIIKYDDQILWNYTGLENYFSNGWLYFYPDLPKLFHFRVRDPFLGHEDHYYVNQNEKWEQISKDDYVKYLNTIVYSSKHGLDHTDDEKGFDDLAKSLERQKRVDSSTEEEGAGQMDIEPGFKEKLYSKYASPDFDPTEDQEILEILVSPHEEDAAEVSKSFEFVKDELIDVSQRRKVISDPELRRRRRLSFDHLEPRGFRQPKDFTKLSESTLPPYRSMEELYSSSEIRDKHYESMGHKKFWSTSDLVNNINDEIYRTMPDSKDSHRSSSDSFHSVGSQKSPELRRRKKQPQTSPDSSSEQSSSSETDSSSEESEKSGFGIPAVYIAFLISLISIAL